MRRKMKLVPSEKYDDAVKFLMGGVRLSGNPMPHLTEAERRSLQECFRGPFLHGHTKQKAKVLIRNHLGWERATEASA
jgi:hypothetical protein